MSRITADRRLYLTADKDRVVEEDDIRGAFLLVAEGRQIDGAEAERLGVSLVDDVVVIGEPPEPEPEVAPEVEPTGLPEDLPGLKALEDAGYESLDEIRAIEDLTAIAGVGDSTAAAIRDFLGDAEGEE